MSLPQIVEKARQRFMKTDMLEPQAQTACYLYFGILCVQPLLEFACESRRTVEPSDSA